MDKKGNNKHLNEGIEMFKYRVGYKINESPRYRPLVNANEEFDEFPNTSEADDPNNMGNQDQNQPQEPIPNQPEPAPEPEMPQPAPDSGTPTPTPQPAFDSGMGDPMQAQEPEQDVDIIQNEIIKHNIEAMKSIHSQLEMLNNMTQNLNQKLDNLSVDVEEVREPSNAEKLMSKNEVSYPYYFNLNDFWSGNWFNQQREKELTKGIRKTADGEYVADFDDLPMQSKTDINNSFNEIY